MEVAVSSDYYNCSSCNINFSDPTEYKKHYAAKFHQYNVKRKVIDLPPVTQEQHDARFNTYADQQKQTVQAREQVQSSNRCDACQKTFANKNSYLSHLQSKKHIENEKKRQQKLENSETQSLQSKTTNQTKTQLSTVDDISVCLFCNIKSKDLEKNMKHMEKYHGFFAAEANYVSDLPGLIKYLAEKINLGNICLYCDNKGKDFKTGEAVQTHMLDKGHCFMSKKNFDEYVGYYDFTVNKEEAKEDEDELDDVEVGEKQDLNAKVEKDQEEDEDWEDEDEEWEDEDDEEDQEEIKEEDEEESEEENEESKAKKELNEIKNKKIQTEKDRQKELKKQFRLQYRSLNKQRLAKVNYAESGELEFDNGKVVGHRQYKKYYNMFYRNRADPFSNLKSIIGPEFVKQRQIMLQQKNYQMQLYNKNQQLLVHNKTDRITHKSIHNFKRHTLRVGMGNNKTKQHHFINQNPL